MQNHAKVFTCELCDFSCSNRSNWKTHTLTAKHQQVTTSDNSVTPKNATAYTCNNCSKVYKSRNGLWVHSKKCGTPDKNQSITDDSLIFQLMKQNDDFKNLLIEQNKAIIEQNTKVFDSHNQLIELCKQNAFSITNNNTVNSHNKTFNLQVFLNEDCKDAMNINEFIDSIQFQLSDLENVGRLGYVEGISNIIIKNLNALDVTKRPVHCTDPKRETIYIKDGGNWEKDENGNKKLRKMVKSVAFRNSKNTRLFKEKYPDCIKSESRYSDIYNKIVIESMGGGPKCNDFDSENKIIRKIAQMITIDKHNL